MVQGRSLSVFFGNAFFKAARSYLTQSGRWQAVHKLWTCAASYFWPQLAHSRWVTKFTRRSQLAGNKLVKGAKTANSAMPLEAGCGIGTCPGATRQEPGNEVSEQETDSADKHSLCRTDTRPHQPNELLQIVAIYIRHGPIFHSTLPPVEQIVTMPCQEILFCRCRLVCG